MFTENSKIISKADVLEYLSGKLQTAHVERVYKVYAEDYMDDPLDVATQIGQSFVTDRHIVVRSSSIREDSYETSNAGHFDSVLGVNPRDRADVGRAIEHVLMSYIDETAESMISADSAAAMDNIAITGDTSVDQSAASCEKVADETNFSENGRSLTECCIDEKYRSVLTGEQVLVQPQTEDIVSAGVVFTRDILKNRPYFTINYSEDGTTDAVTSGRGGKTMHIAHSIDVKTLPIHTAALITAVREILTLTDIDNLDIEFGIKSSGEVVIFQCRPLAAVMGKTPIATDEDSAAAIRKAESDYQKIGHTLSDMAFWNPSEIIGDNPYPLDYSLYREIITSYIWSAGISSMGYHYINDDLMYKLGNKPYISVDYSFEGLIPEMLSPRLQRKLKNYYMNKLLDDPSAHDKIEFEIVFSVYDFCTEENLDILLDHGFSKNEINDIRKSLFLITTLAIKSYQEIYHEDIRSLERMRDLRQGIRAESPLRETDPDKLLGYVGALLTSIKTDGTPQFARMARLAFIAQSFLRTLAIRGYISEEEADLFKRSINTVASDFERDFDDLSRGEMTREEFNDKYGHLRLGTYNIRTDCYSEMYFDIDKTDLETGNKRITEPYTLNRENVSRALMDYEMDFTADELIDYIRMTTENREYFKFEFTKSLSLILNILIRLGELYGISRNDLSYLEIMDFSLTQT